MLNDFTNAVETMIADGETNIDKIAEASMKSIEKLTDEQKKSAKELI